MKRYLAILITVAVTAAGCGKSGETLLPLETLPKIGSITIEGNHRFSEGTLSGLMVTKKGQRFRRAQFASDLKAIQTYYMRHGYLRARIVDQSIRDSGSRVHLTVRINEGTPFTVSEVVIQGARALNPNRLRQKLALRAGDPMDPFALGDDRLLILYSLGELGYWNARVETNVQFFGNEALVFYLLEEGGPVTLRELRVSGNNEVRTDQVLRNISVKEGEPLRRDDLVRSQTRLLQSGFFSDAQWDTTALDTLTGEVDVEFRVRERKLQWVEAGVGYNSQEQLRFTGEWGWRNFIRSGTRFAINNRTDIDLSGRVKTLVRDSQTDFILNRAHIPWVSWETQLVPSYIYIREATAEGFEYQQDIIRGALSIRRRFGDLRNQFATAFENRWVWNNADSGAAAADPQLQRDFYQTRLISGFVERDTRNDFFSPTAGGYQRALLQWAGGALGGNNSFIKSSVSGSGFRRVPVKKWSVATRIQLGYTVPTIADPSPDQIEVELIPTEDRFYLGGSTTVRGYKQDQIDGRVLAQPGLPEGGLAEWLFNVELRIPLFWRFGLVTFLDSGGVWQDKRLISLDRWIPHSDPNNVEQNDVRYTYGVGLRFATPVGPVRVDYARKWNQPAESLGGKDDWHLALGQAF